MTLHEELNIANANINLSNQMPDQSNKEKMFQEFMTDFKQRYNSLASDLFYGANYDVMQCAQCGNSLYNYDIYFSLIFPLQEVKKFIQQNNNNSINNNIKQRNSDAKINQLLKSPIEYNSKSIFGNERKNKILSINILSNSKNKNINEKNVSEFCIENNEESEHNASKNNNNFDEYLDVINVYNKKKCY